MAFFIILAIYIIALFVPILAKIIIHFDYVLVLVAVWILVFGAGGHFEHGLFANHEAIHTVFVILIYLAAIAAWFGLQNIRIFKVYIFRVLACALSAFVLTYLVSTGLLGESIADGMDTIWQWAIGITYFAVALGLRAKQSNLIRET